MDPARGPPGPLLLPAGPRAPRLTRRAGPSGTPAPASGLSTGSGLSAAPAGRGTLPGGNLPNASSPSTLSPDRSQQKLSRKLSLPLAAHTRRSHSSLPPISRTELGSGLRGSHSWNLQRNSGQERGDEVMRKRERKEREGGKDLRATSLLSPPVSTLQCLRAPPSITPVWTDKKDGQQEAVGHRDP